MNDKHNLYTDYRELWGSPQSSFEDLIANSHYPWRDAFTTDFSAALKPFDTKTPDYTFGVANAQHELTAPVSGIIAGDNPADYSIQLDHHHGELIQRKDISTFVITPPEGGCF